MIPNLFYECPLAGGPDISIFDEQICRFIVAIRTEWHRCPVTRFCLGDGVGIGLPVPKELLRIRLEVKWREKKWRNRKGRRIISENFQFVEKMHGNRFLFGFKGSFDENL